MPPVTSNKKSPGGWNPFLTYAGLLAVILAVLFHRSFNPDEVAFSNDAPLGAYMAAANQMPGVLTGCWGDLTALGFNSGAVPIDPVSLLLWVAGPVGFSKFLTPITVFFLGLSAWFLFRQLKFTPLAAILGGLVAALNASFFSRACWGLGSHPIAIGMDFLALGLIVANTPQTPALTRWTRLALAGLAVGVNVMEGADVGAIFSLFVAAFVFYKAVNEDGVPVLKKIGGGILRTAVVAVFAGFIASQTILSLVGTQIAGIVGTAQDEQTRAANWDKATEWSLPKKETLGILVPGLFGYRMDTPRDMMPSLQDAYQGGAYWGGAGRTPEIDRYFDKIFQPGDVVKIIFPDDPGQNVALTVAPDGNVNLPQLGQTKLAGISGSELLQIINPAYASRGIKAYVESPGGIMRFNGDGHYLGILVTLLVAFAIGQSLRREKSPFTVMEKKFVWFWAALLTVSLLLAWGRFAPFYRFFYALPYVSTIRNPDKFLLVFSWAAVILSGYGLHLLSRRYLEIPATGTSSFSTQLINWWKKVRGFDRKWTIACAVAIAASALGWLLYSAQKTGLISYLQTVGFDVDTAKSIASFSFGQAGWFVLIFALAAGFFTLVIAGIFSGKRAKLGGILLGALLLLDLGRADLPFVIHQDYVQKYAGNPVLDLLKDKPYEHRVADLPFRAPEQLQKFEELYRIEWMQHHFPYYNIQSLDVVQMSRTAANFEAFEDALAFHNTADTAYLVPRRWQLTNTRYLLGPAGYLDGLNSQFDPGQKRFSIVQRFSVLPKPGIANPYGISPEQFANYLPADKDNAFSNPDGPYALFEFTGALPRVKLYSNWQASTNDPAKLQAWSDGLKPYLPEASYGILTNLNPTDQATLQTLSDKNFDPEQTVLVATALPAATSTNGNPGTVGFKSYSPKNIVLDARSATPSVLLLNDKYDPNWRVTVDGKPAELLRCNFIMRGVYLPPGSHTVEFNFTLPNKPLYVTLAAMTTGILLLGLLVFLQRRKPAAET
jgi:hypothetical protein